MRALPVVLVLLACNAKSDKPQQTAKQALELMCDARERSGATEKPPADRQSHIATWIDRNVTNPEIRMLVEELGVLAPAPRKAALDAALKTHGVATCELAETSRARAAGLDVPMVAQGGVVRELPEAPVIVVSPSSIVVEGKAVVSVQGGAIDPAELEGGALGISIPRLRVFLAAVLKEAPGTTMTIAMDRALPYKLLVQVAYTARKAGYRELALLVARDGRDAVIPILLPTSAGDGGSLVPGPSPPLQMAVAVTASEVRLFSISGLEGTLQQPALVVPHGDLARISAALSDIVARRMTGPRSAADRQIVTLFEPTTPIQRVAEVLAAVRSTDSGTELFPDVQLSVGFE